MIKNQHNWPLEHWHIELCSKCSLLCPRCSRQEVPGGLTNQELNLEWFEKNFTQELVDHVKKITLCGDDGDPIYAKDLIAIIKHFKNINSKIQFVIVTNGSYKTEQWWNDLFKVCDESDHIHFSIDGWDQTSNNKYRINSNWESIMTAVKTAGSYKIFKTWATIAFKFNEAKIHDIKDIASQNNFDLFQLTLSSKFGCNYETYPKDDPLQPSEKFIARGRFTRQVYPLSKRKWSDSTQVLYQTKYKQLKHSNDSIIPLCGIGNKGLYINSQGKFFPCCWTGLRYPHNQGLFEHVNYDNNLLEVLNDPGWNKLFESWELNSCPQECSEKCSAKKFTLEHATSW
jgi:MoaA/NifB/PqqE/SkfB family radical SAM enzyme